MRLLTFFLFLSLAFPASEGLPRAFLEEPVIRQGQYVLWHDPGNVEMLDFRYGIGGAEFAPQPPFTFVDEDSEGTNPKLTVRDANGRRWSVKFGPEASPDTFCSTLAWAAGYYVEPTYFVADGVINGVHDLQRTRKDVDEQGRFHSGRFQLRTQDPKFLRWVNWAWDDNPFLGTPELNGLKILMMLVSNWDDKDSRDANSRGTNTAIYQHDDLYFYFIDDWGGAMGHWGKYFTRSKWNHRNFSDQSPRFVSLGSDGIRWGYTGQHTELLTHNIGVGDIRWLLRYLGRITDDQLRTGLLASGASNEVANSYVQALRARIRQLQAVAGR